MILELDCGNTLIKWRLLSTGETHSGVVSDAAALLDELKRVSVGVLRGARLASVRSEQETDAIASTLEETFGVRCQVAMPAERLGGVRNGYEDYRGLGMDRWLALVGAFTLARKACLVLDLGTAITADFVSSEGGHLGGFICPGMPLLRSDLRTHTSRIRYGDDAAHDALRSSDPGRSTPQAVERGCLWMVRGFVQEQRRLASHLLGAEHEIFLTGGDAELVLNDVPHARLAPDLVFTGLAVACPLE